MADHEKRDERAQRLMSEVLAAMGRELRTARLGLDLSQTDAGRAIGVSTSTWSRMERGAVPNLALLELGRALAVVGLNLRVRAYPGGRPLRDDAHLKLLERLHGRLGPGVRWRTEVPLPLAEDRRAWDALILVGAVSIGIEAETRARHAQDLQRRVALKQRDGGVDQVILLLADTRHNRAFVSACGEGFRSAFPVDGRIALQRLAVPADPGGSAIILI